MPEVSKSQVNLLPLEPGNCGQIVLKPSIKDKKSINVYRHLGYAHHNSLQQFSILDETNGPFHFTKGAYIEIIAHVLCGKNYEPSVLFNSKNTSNLVIAPSQMDRIAGLRPITPEEP